MGPVVSEAQWNKVQRLIQKGIDEGAPWSPAAPAVPRASTRAIMSSPTVFANVTNDMTIAREEIFGPVLSILGYDTVDEAVEIANDTEYGLAAYISGGDWRKSARWLPAIARRPGAP